MTRIIAKRKLKSGKTITYKAKDKGKKGKTPEKERWYRPTAVMGWKKDLPATTRRRLALRGHKGDKLATARALQALANVTTDAETKKLARRDAQYFFDLYRKGKQ